MVKEVYFHAWYAFEDGERLKLHPNSYGLSSFEVEGVGSRCAAGLQPLLGTDPRGSGGLGLGG